MMRVLVGEDGGGADDGNDDKSFKKSEYLLTVHCKNRRKKS